MFCVSFKKLQTFMPATLLKRDPTQVFPCEYCKIFNTTFFEKHMQMAAF